MQHSLPDFFSFAGAPGSVASFVGAVGIAVAAAAAAAGGGGGGHRVAATR